MGANEELFDSTLRHHVALQQVTARDLRLMDQKLVQAELELINKLKLELVQGMTRQRLALLLRDVRALRSAVLKELRGQHILNLRSLANLEVQADRKNLEDAIGLLLGFATVSADVLNEIIVFQPFSGGANAARTLDQWWASVGAADARRIEEALQMGMVQGETVDQMVRRVQQVLPLTRANAEALVITASSHVTNSVREALFQANGGLLRILRWTSVLDGRTTIICMGRDGHFAPVQGTSTEGIPPPHLNPPTARPPAHPRCRSVMNGVIDPEGLADLLPDRPFVRDTRTAGRRQIDFRADAKATMSDKAWAALTEVDRRGVIRGVKLDWAQKHVGQVPGITTYDQWLRKQPRWFQDDVLGKGKAELFRNGLKLDKFVNRAGKELTLDELHARYQA